MAKHTRKSLTVATDALWQKLLGRIEAIERRWTTEDAVELEHIAHILEGIEDICRDLADTAGALAITIDPDVESKV